MAVHTNDPEHDPLDYFGRIEKAVGELPATTESNLLANLVRACRASLRFERGRTTDLLERTERMSGEVVDLARRAGEIERLEDDRYRVISQLFEQHRRDIDRANETLQEVIDTSAGGFRLLADAKLEDRLSALERGHTEPGCGVQDDPLISGLRLDVVATEHHDEPGPTGLPQIDELRRDIETRVRTRRSRLATMSLSAGFLSDLLDVVEAAARVRGESWKSSSDTMTTEVDSERWHDLVDRLDRFRT